MINCNLVIDYGGRDFVVYKLCYPYTKRLGNRNVIFFNSLYSIS